jgi:hypothetical protein
MEQKRAKMANPTPALGDRTNSQLV